MFSRIPKLLSFGALAGVFALAGCGGSSDYAYVKFIHASPGAPNVDVQIASTFAAQNTAYGDATMSYAQVNAGTNEKVQVFAAGKDTTAVLSANATFTKNQYYTILALNTPAKLQAVIENDDLTPPTSGDCKIRVVHGSPSAGAVDVYVTAPGVSLTDPKNPVTPVLTNFSFGTVTKYLEVPAGSYEVRVTATGDPSAVAIDTGSTGVPLMAGDIYTAVALDPNPSSTPPGTAFSLLLTQDQPVQGVTPTAPTGM
ncbi:MAG: DUF4397 domain-containing protein [Terracidiphilus sp.]